MFIFLYTYLVIRTKLWKFLQENAILEYQLSTTEIMYSSMCIVWIGFPLYVNFVVDMIENTLQSCVDSTMVTL